MQVSDVKSHWYQFFLLAVVLALALPGCGTQPMTASTQSQTSSASENGSSAEEPERSDVPEETESMTDVSESEDTTDAENNTITLTVGGEAFNVVLYDNDSVSALKDTLPLSLSMSELHGNEKYCTLPNALPTGSETMESIRAGDLMLYGSDCLVLFYESFSTSYSYTRLGYVEDTAGLADALGDDAVQITLN